jgi:hypothetical protein
MHIALKPSGLANVQLTIHEEFADWPDMLRVAQILGIPLHQMEIEEQGYDTGQKCKVCAFTASRQFLDVPASVVAKLAASLGISIEKSWFPDAVAG